MKTLWFFLLLAVVVSATATDWRVLSEWEVPEVFADPDDATNIFAFGLAYADSNIYVSSWNPDEIFPDPPWVTNLYVYDESGNYQGTQFSSDITDIDVSGVDYDGTDWYMGKRRESTESTIYLVAGDGSSYTSFAGPATFNRLYGVAYNPDNSILYVSDWSTGNIAWGSVGGSGHVTSWTEVSIGINLGALVYGSANGNDYLFGVEREQYFYSGLHIWELDGSGQPDDYYLPDDFINFGEYFYYPGDIDWDGEYLWVLNQNVDGAGGMDAVTKIALPGYSDYLINITPASLGEIKAKFR